jgi:DNA polymerase-1
MSKILGKTDAIRLLMEGQEALAQVEANGMRVDVPYLKRMIDESAEVLRRMEADLKKDEVWSLWQKVYGAKANINGTEQLGRIIFDEMGVKCEERTPTGLPKTDEEALERVKHPFVAKYVNRKKLFTARNTFLLGIMSEVVGDHIHPMYSLNTIITYRSASSYPNSQNFPNRVGRTAKLVRQAFIPEDDCEIVEFDLKGAEVCVSECYHHDPTMLKYILEGYDYHKELAMQCFMLEREQVTKSARHVGKNGFVFPSFYGDWWMSIAKGMWNAIETDGLTRVDGVGLIEHLASKGITRLGDQNSKDRDPPRGTFEAHIKEVYHDFWNVRFPVYSQWKEDWFDEYIKNGYCHSLTGFTYQGVSKRNEIINYPIQGSSFHCLLWALIKIQQWLKKNKMRSKIIGQIHDSIIMSIHRKERDDVLPFAYRTMTQDIRKEWDWVIVRLDVEAAGSYRNWYEKEEIDLKKLAV